MNTQILELDVDKRGGGNNCIRIAQGEAGGTTIKALVYDNGAEFDLTGYAANLVVRLPDRIHYYKGAATVSGNAVSHVCEEEKLASVAGYTDEAYFEFSKGERTVQTERFALDIMRDARDGLSPASSWDNAIEELMERGKAAVVNSELAVNKANTATAKADTATAKADTAASNADAATAKASTAAIDADTATQAANDAAADALEAAEEARGSISPDKRVYLTYDTVGDTDYISLVDTEE